MYVWCAWFRALAGLDRSWEWRSVHVESFAWKISDTVMCDLIIMRVFFFVSRTLTNPVVRTEKKRYP